MANRHSSTWIGSAAGVVVLALAAWLGVDVLQDSGVPEPRAGSGPSSSPAATPRPGASGDAASTASQHSTPHPGSESGRFPSCPLGTLPQEADEVAGLISVGGPFKYPSNDGTRFGNYEGVLPAEPGGYYREYTVDTPGLGHRGTRRIITGGSKPQDPEVWYYTSDHYESFCEIPDAEKD